MLHSYPQGAVLRRWASYSALSLAALLTACGGSDSPSEPTPPQPRPNLDAELTQAQIDTADRCDLLDSSHCMLPFPSNFLTVADSTTPTGRRLNLQRESMPLSTLSEQRIDPAEWNRNDGFSPGAMLVTRVPDVDLARTGAATIGDVSASLDKDAPVMLLNARTLQPQLIWAELDENNVSSPNKQTLNIRVAKNLDWGERYIVVLRNLKNAQGESLQASPAFRIYRDQYDSSIQAVNARRPQMEALFAELSKAGIARESLYLAWDFTVASQANGTGRLLAMRDQGLGTGPGGAPTYTIDKITDQPDGSDTRIARRIEGTLTVPSFLSVPSGSIAPNRLEMAIGNYALNKTLDLEQMRMGFTDLGGAPPALQQMHYSSATPSANDLPVQNSSMQVPFTCNIPESVLKADGSVEPARISLYGHGLFGRKEEVNASNVKSMAQEHNFVFCAADWYGFSFNQVTKSVISMLDLSYARSMFDMSQQGIFNMMALGRAMKHPQGFASDPAFQMGATPSSVIDNQALFYDGNSQGGIMGGALMAVSQDIERGVLGVPGMNYSLLLERSSDFPIYSTLLYAAYPDSLEQQLIFSLWQTLWDRAEANGYASAMGNQPLPNTPAHQVLLQVAYGDHQVTTWSAEIMARSMGAKLSCPSLEQGRHPDANPFVGLDCATLGAANDSVLVMWDSGPGRTTPPPQNNTPPVTGVDPHSDPRSTPEARLQKSEFLRVGGSFVDTCNGMPCKSAAYVP